MDGAAIDDCNFVQGVQGVLGHAAFEDIPHVVLVADSPHRPGMKFRDVGEWSVSVELICNVLGRVVCIVAPSAEMRVRNPIFCPQTVQDFLGVKSCGGRTAWATFHQMS